MSLYEFSKNYIRKRTEAFSGEDIEALEDRLRKIKEESIKNLESLRKAAVENLRSAGVTVHEAEDNETARKLLRKLIPKGSSVAKSKSNTLNELEIKELGEECSWKLTETDLGDFVVSLLSEGRDHPVLPALGVSLDQICKAARAKLEIEIEQSPEGVVRALSLYIRGKILEAESGLTGANAITAEGQIVILENEGNISLVSRIPRIHVAVAGIEKIVPTLEDAIHVCRCASIWGTGQKMASYINIISGPSKTADIEDELVVGAQGAQEVHLVLVDDWRSSFIGGDFEELLYCINCGACLNTCPVFVSAFETIKTLDSKLCFDCTTCASCTFNCPAKIDWETMVKKARAKFTKEGKVPEEFQEMIKNVRRFGNPFGEVPEGKIPDKLYCC